MKRKLVYCALLVKLITISSLALGREFAWSGQAKVAPRGAFEGFSSVAVPKAASNSFPIGLRVRVTNPKNGREVTVQIVRRGVEPGLLVTLSASSGSFLQLKEETVAPVQVALAPTTTGSTSHPDASYGFDPDDNISEEAQIAYLSLLREKANQKNRDSRDAIETSTVGRSKPEPVTPLYTRSRSNGLKITQPPPKILITPPAPQTPPSSEKVYYLSPAEFRPPEGAPAKSFTFSQLYRDRLIPKVRLGIYLQVGAFRSQEILYENLEKLNSDYPLLVLQKEKSGDSYHRLVVGPLNEEEVPSVRLDLESRGYEGIFRYYPPK